MAKTVEFVSGEFRENFDLDEVALPIAGDPSGKNLLSMLQLAEPDIYDYIEEATAALPYAQGTNGIDLLSRLSLTTLMRQPSTRTGGSMEYAMKKLGGSGELISGMQSSSEAKGESLSDSWEAIGTQSDMLGVRTAEDYGAAFAAHAIARSCKNGKLPRAVPVINLGDGRNEHPTQALGDLFTIHKALGRLRDVKLAVVGDHERYRAFHSLLIGAAAVGMEVVSVEADVAPMPHDLVALLGNRLERTTDLDAAMLWADVLYMGRNPDEYTIGKDKRPEDRTPEERYGLDRSEKLAAAYEKWVVDNKRLQIMPADSIVLHPRPRRNELHPSVDADQRMKDVEQMANMIPMRMAIIARHFGKSIRQAVETEPLVYVPSFTVLS